MTKTHAPAPLNPAPAPLRRPIGPILDHRAFERPRVTRTPTALGVLAKEWLDDRAGRGLHITTEESAWRITMAAPFGSIRADELRPEEIEAWIRALLASGYSPNSVRHRVWTLRAFLEWCLAEGAIAANPVAQIRKQALPRAVYSGRGEREVLTLDEVAAVVFAPLPETRGAFWAALLLTGARFGEAAALDWGDFDPKREPLGELTLRRSWDCKRHEMRPSTKERHVRRIPVHPTLVQVLKALRAAQERELERAVTPADPMFPRYPLTRREGPVRWSETSALRAWRRDLLALGIEHPPTGPRRLHGARHTFVSILLEGGVDPHFVEHLTHPKTPKTSFNVYAHSTWPGLCRAILGFKIPEPVEAPRLVTSAPTVHEVAKALGINHAQAYAMVKAGRLLASSTRVRHSPEVKARALRLLAGGATQGEVGRMLDVHPRTLRVWLVESRGGK